MEWGHISGARRRELHLMMNKPLCAVHFYDATKGMSDNKTKGSSTMKILLGWGNSRS